MLPNPSIEVMQMKIVELEDELTSFEIPIDNSSGRLCEIYREIYREIRQLRRAIYLRNQADGRERRKAAHAALFEMVVDYAIDCDMPTLVQEDA